MQKKVEQTWTSSFTAQPTTKGIAQQNTSPKITYESVIHCLRHMTMCVCEDTIITHTHTHTHTQNATMPEQ